MATSIELDNVSNSWDEHSVSNDHRDLTAPIQLVAQAAPAEQAAAPAQTAPASAEPVPVDVGGGAPAAAPPAANAAHEYVADASNVVRLPANVSIDNIKVDGHNLVLEQADGSVIVIKDGALNVPTFIIGEVEVPRVALIAALEASHVDVAFGTDGSISAGPGGSASSAGGNFEQPAGGIGDGFGLSALLPPTDLHFGQLDHRELFPSLVDRGVSVVAMSLTDPGQAASETGLDGGSQQSPGSDAPSNSETSGVGTISIDAPDGIGSIVINGTTVTGVNQQIAGEFGYITILSFDPGTGAIQYDYTVTESVTHPVHTTGYDANDTVPDTFSITVTDVDGDTASTTFAVAIVDDVPTAVADTDSVTEGGTASGNVITGVGSDGNAAGADTKGADGAAVSGVTGSGATTVVGGDFHVVGQYGTLTLSPDGTYSYVANSNISNASPVTDTFTYTLKDGDGDTSQTTLTITINDGANPSVVTNAVIAVDEEGLGTANATGSAPATNVEDGSGTVTFHAGSDDITGVAFTSVAGITADVNGVAGADIVWTLAGPTQIVGSINGIEAIHIDLVASSLPILAGTNGSATVNVTLLDNFPHPDAGGQNVINLTGINVVATDSDGDQASATVQVNVTDDVPTLGSFTSATIPNEIGTVNGTFNVSFGADGHSTNNAFDITGPVIDGIHYTETDLGNGTTRLLAEDSNGTDIFALTVKADATYTFELITPGAATTEQISFAQLGAGGPGFRELADDPNTPVNELGRVEFQSNGNGVNASNQGFGVSNQWTDYGEWFEMEFHKPGVAGNDAASSNPDLLESVTINIQQIQQGPVTIRWTATNPVNGDTETHDITVSSTGPLTIDPTIQFSVLKIENIDTVGTGSLRIGTDVSVSHTILPPDQTLDFHIVARDGDGDLSSSSTLSINVETAGTGGNFTLTGTAGNDVIAASTHTDTMTGGAGADTFVIGSGESTPVIGGSGNAGTITGYDIITDFVAGTDKLTLPGSLVAATAGNVNGGDSTLTIGGDTVQSHSVTNGIASFFGTDTFTAPLAVTSAASLAAVVQYLNATDIGDAGATLAFTATISGVNHTYVYTQTTTNAGVGALVDLQGVTISNLNNLIGGSVDPIILDLNHNGFAFSDVSHGVQFDMNGDGTKEQLAWNTSHDGMLAVDLNHDGKIDDGTELFTPNFNGGHFDSGAAALASLDSNHDGVIDHNDAAFSSLLIWQDANANGISDTGELSHLADNGIVSISTAANAAVGEIDGQTVTGNGTFQMADGTSGNYVEVELDTSLVASTQPSVAMDGTSGADTFKIDNLNIKDLIVDYHGDEGDKIDLTALFDKAPAGNIADYVHYNSATSTVSVDTSGSGNAANFVDVAVLQNAPAAGTINILYDDATHTQQHVTI
ncbi:type I secretion C-terminal target domain-containing protein [Mesorhizobium sp. M00.F.Ca.ET.151.01.1.1]|nr:type I secretion C-terminal target domain-containing protein [Mesorhizobium sp. M00.F.Ca.ET.151.01.1.1]